MPILNSFKDKVFDNFDIFSKHDVGFIFIGGKHIKPIISNL